MLKIGEIILNWTLAGEHILLCSESPMSHLWKDFSIGSQEYDASSCSTIVSDGKRISCVFKNFIYRITFYMFSIVDFHH
jgi:hypothetical protein